jgi:hypothetical protein
MNWEKVSLQDGTKVWVERPASDGLALAVVSVGLIAMGVILL